VLDGQEETVFIFEAVDRGDDVLLPVLHLLLLRDVNGDLEEVVAGDVLVPFEPLVGDLDVLLGVCLFAFGFRSFVTH
jgi:hypothetical protein